MSKTFRTPWGVLLCAVCCLCLVRCTREQPASGTSAPPRQQSQSLAFEPAFLVKELDSVAPWRLTRTERPMLRVGAYTYFTAPDRSNGTELWKTDGTEGGTSLVRDIRPGLGSSDPRGFTELGGLLYFTADDGTNGRELWRTDGTAEGTVLVKDLHPGANSSSPLQLANVGGQLLFTASHALGSALYKSDGTAEGTVPLLDGSISIGPGASILDTVPVVGGTYFFAMSDANHGEELWRSDGTVQGTLRVKDIFPGRSGSSPDSFTVVGQRFFFVADDGGTGRELWTSDGTEPGTWRVEDIRPGLEGSAPHSLTAVGGLLFFVAYDGGTGEELYRSDGFAPGTFLVKDLLPVEDSSSPSLLTDVGGTLFFSAYDEQFQRALWRSDGSPEGVQKVALLDSKAAVVQGGTLYLEVRTAENGRELWKSDGTPEGTLSLATLLPPLGTTPSVLLAPLDTGLALWVEDGAFGRALWTSDGTGDGTRLVREFPTSQNANGLIEPAVDLEGTLFFVGSSPETGTELWKSDGTPEGTGLVKDLNPGGGGASPQSFRVLDGRLYFWARYSPISGGELWTSDGTEAGTQKLASFTSVGSFGGSIPPYLVPAGGRLYFTTRSSRELRWIDGTVAETRLVRDFWPEEIENLTAVGSTLFFTVSSPEWGQTLWKTDGTEAGTVQVKTLASSYILGTPHHLIGAGGTLFFWVRSSYDSADVSLWKSDGTGEGTVPVLAGSRLAGTYNTPDVVAEVGGRLFFAAERLGESGFELWTSDGTPEGTVRLKDLGPHAYFKGIPASLTEMNGRLFFLNNDGVHGYELWTSNGTPEGTVPVKDVAPGLASAIAGRQPLVPLGPEGPLVFAASDGLSGLELWSTDGTEAGTRLLEDLSPGAASSNPRLLGTAGSLLFFQADDGNTGHELWALSNPLADRVAPTVSCPADQTLEATSLQGAAALFPAAQASDDRTDPPRILYSLAVGTSLALGSHSVTATAIDAAGNTGSCSFQVTVQDTTAPLLSCPGARVAEATRPEGTAVSYPPATVVDVASIPQLTYSQASGTLFPLGDTSVSVTATDGAGLSATCAFSVSVRDTQAPQLTCPPEQTVEATGPLGATVTYPPATATDAVSTPVLDYSLASGSTFSLGTSEVRVTATDEAGLSSECRFPVHVRDVTPPALTCPMDVEVETSHSSGTLVSYPEASAEDAVSSVSMHYSVSSGSGFVLGSTPVEVTATDEAGNVSRCQFQVTVRYVRSPDAGTPSSDAGTPGPGSPPPPPFSEPASSCGCQSGGGASAANALLLAWGLVALRVRRRRGSLRGQASHASR